MLPGSNFKSRLYFEKVLAFLIESESLCNKIKKNYPLHFLPSNDI